MKSFLIIATPDTGIVFPLAFLAAFMVAAAMIFSFGRKRGYPTEDWTLILTAGAIGFIMGEKLFTWSINEWASLFTSLHFSPAPTKNALSGIAGMVAGLFLAKKILGFRLPVLDSLAVALPLALAISRVGCFFTGCCFGCPTGLPWAVRYDPASMAAHLHLAEGLINGTDACSLPVHPVQLYQSAGCMVTALAVWRLSGRCKAPGSRFLLFVLVYGVIRFWLEFMVDPSSGHFAAPLFWGMSRGQWVILAGMIPVSFLLWVRERSAGYRTGQQQEPGASPPRAVELRRILFAICLSWLIIRGRAWFDMIELTAITLFILSSISLLILAYFRSHTQAGFRWAVPAILFCSILFMSQKNDDSLKKITKITYHEAGLYGLAGRYYEDLKEVHYTGCDSYELIPRKSQGTSFYEISANYSYHILKKNGRHYSFGARVFYGDEKPEQTAISSGKGPIYGISPYFTLDSRYFGLMTGFSLGRMKIPVSQPEEELHNGEIISQGYSWVTIVPALGIRVGTKENLFLEGVFPGLFPASAQYPLFRVGLGTGLGKNDGTKIAMGYADGIYCEAAIPVTRVVVLEAMAASNLNGHAGAKWMGSFGIRYRPGFPKKKVLDDMTRIQPSSSGVIRMTDIDSNKYPSMKVAPLVWAASDLRVTRFRNGEAIPGGWQDTVLPGRYTWNAVTDTRSLCPAGWHVPAVREWMALYTTFSRASYDTQETIAEFAAGVKIKQWWSSASLDNEKAQTFYLNQQTGVMMVTGADKTAFLPVRCVRNYK